MNGARKLQAWWPAAVFVAGILLASAVAEAAGVPANDTVKVLIESSAGAAASGAAAALLLIGLRRARLAIQVAVAALAPVAAVAIGISWATSNMFITEHDLRILWVVLVGAGAAGMASALFLGRRVALASRSVGEMARRLGESGHTGAILPPSRPGELGELAHLAAELRRTSDLLAAAQLEAEALETSRRELVAWVSHDLRTPLAGIRAMVEALEDGIVADPPTIGRYHATIRLEVDRLAGLVDDLFELSRIHAGTIALAMGPVALDELVADALAGAGVAARAKNVELRSRIAQPSPVVKAATPEMIRVVRNLLDNAIRHTPPNGSISLDARVDQGSWVEVSVQDGCGGIPPEDLDRVFEMGFRGDLARTPGEGRGGLGLAVAQGLVEAHDGQIVAVNEEGGCRFTVRLPIHKSTAG